MTPPDVTAPNDIGAIEQQLLARLVAEVAGVAIEPFPNNPDAYRLTHQVGAVLVGYRGAQFGALEATDVVVQDVTYHYDIVVHTRSLAGHQGSYTYLTAARFALAGYRVPGCRKAYPVRERFLGYKEGVWTYALTIAVPTVSVELEDDAPDPPLITRVTVTDGTDTSEIQNA